MTTTNPYADDPQKAEIFDLGYVAGFQDPDGSGFLPLSPELLDIYQQGIDNGRYDAAHSPTPWVPRSELETESSDEWVEHILIEGVAEGAAHLFEKAALGLIGVLITVLQIPGDTALHPLEDDGLSERYRGADNDPGASSGFEPDPFTGSSFVAADGHRQVRGADRRTWAAVDHDQGRGARGRREAAE